MYQGRGNGLARLFIGNIQRFQQQADEMYILNLRQMFQRSAPESGGGQAERERNTEGHAKNHGGKEREQRRRRKDQQQKIEAQQGKQGTAQGALPASLGGKMRQELPSLTVFREIRSAHILLDASDSVFV